MKQPNKKLLETIASLYEVSTKQAASWVDLLDKEYIEEALQKQGLQDKEIKELFK
jgi:PIN domain nuclease of toxin-antitoxin system